VKREARAPLATHHSPDATISELEAGLRYDPRDLSDALSQQPELFYRVAKRLAMAISNADTVKLELSDLKAQLTVDAYDNELKPTADKVSSIVRVDPTVISLAKELITCDRIVGELTALKESYIQRGYSLRTEGELQTSAASPIDAAEGRARLHQARQDYQARRTPK
jgi:hypothetical protein